MNNSETCYNKIINEFTTACSKLQSDKNSDLQTDRIVVNFDLLCPNVKEAPSQVLRTKDINFQLLVPGSWLDYSVTYKYGIKTFDNSQTIEYIVQSIGISKPTQTILPRRIEFVPIGKETSFKLFGFNISKFTPYTV